MATTCRSLISELQKIWDEIGEETNERDKMIFELEQECLNAYKRKVDQANCDRAQLRQQIADSEAQLAEICAALGDRLPHIKKMPRKLKDELEAIMPQLDEMKKKRNERKKQFAEVMKQISSVTEELSPSAEENLKMMIIDDTDLSLKRLEDLHNQLLLLEKEKTARLRKVDDLLNTLNTLCLVLGMDFKLIICEIHQNLDDSCRTKSITVDTIQSLTSTICRIRDVKLQRMQKLQDLAMTMVELWNLMDTPVEEQRMFQNVARTIAASENEITEPNSLSLEVINNAEAEVTRLQDMKASKMKEVLLKKKLVLEEVCRGAHMVIEGQFAANLSLDAIESGAISPNFLLEQLEAQISKVQDEASSRSEILEKVQKWLAACEEESWLEEYNMDDNRYNAGRGTHLMLKRAEKARVLVNKIPGMVETLKLKVKAWEQERGSEFLYDGVGLLSMIDQYSDLKHLKEQERLRQRDQKKLHGQLITEQEAIYGSKPSPSKSGNKNCRPSIGGVANKRFSVGGAMLQNAVAEKTSFSSRLAKTNPVKKHTSHNQNHSVSMAYSSDKEKVSGSTVKQHLNNKSSSQQTALSLIRRPLSPISSLSSNIISCGILDQNQTSGELRDKNRTPTKNVSAVDENRTPKRLPIPMPSTPPTVSIAMQTAMTPFTPKIHRDNNKVEYSYEERRAGFIV